MLLIVNNSNHNIKVSQTKKLLKALTELNIPYIEYHKIKDFNKYNIKGIILTGSPLKISQSLKLEDYKNNINAMLLFPNVPVLGICFGCQLLHVLNGGKLKNQGDYNCKDFKVELSESKLFNKKDQDCFFCFSDLILPPYSKQLAWFYFNNKKYPCAFQFNNNHYGCLFHPEAKKDTLYILTNFIKNIIV